MSDDEYNSSDDDQLSDTDTPIWEDIIPLEPAIVGCETHMLVDKYEWWVHCHSVHLINMWDGVKSIVKRDEKFLWSNVKEHMQREMFYRMLFNHSNQSVRMNSEID